MNDDILLRAIHLTKAYADVLSQALAFRELHGARRWAFEA
jgi:hypothetical protein